MNTNPIEELRRMETPVTEEGWNSIVNDSRYTRKFGRKNGLSPKGRAAIIGGAAAVLIAVPILVKTLTQGAKETAQTNIPTTENVQSTVENVTNTAIETSTETTPTTVSVSQPGQETHTPAKIAVTEQTAKQEGSTMISVMAKRQQNAVNQSREEWPPVLFPEPDGSRLSYDNFKTNPARRDTTGLRHSERIRTVIDDPLLNQNINAGISETTVATDGQVSTKYEYSSEEPATETEQFFIPSAFTPNGDGLNDLFYVKANFEPRSFEMAVISRGGDVLFQTRDMNIGWDGMLHGNLLPQGVYVIIIKYKDSEGNEHKQQGQVLLIP